MDKSGTDDQLVEALRAEIQRLQSKLRASEEQALRRTRDRSDLSGSMSARNPSSSSSQHRRDENEEVQQLHSEIHRLQRLCRNQVRENIILSIFCTQFYWNVFIS